MEHLDYRRKITIMIAVMSAMLFASLNQTIVGTALPKIIAVLGGMEYYSWVFTVYMLTSCITAILVGKLSDIYGRKSFILLGIAVFMIGSFLNGLSQNIFHLIIFRGVQGLGGGMIMSTSFTVVGDLFSPRERGRWQGFMGASFGLASVFGPTLGGYIVDKADWHWVFWVFLPFGLLALLLIWWLLPRNQKGDLEAIDYKGALLLITLLVPMLLAFTWAGQDYAWDSLQVLGLLVISVLSLFLFIFVEQKAAHPILPLYILKDKVVAVSNGVAFLIGVGMFSTIMYMPLFVQGVIGESATASGFITMPMTISMVSASAVSGQIISNTGKYKKLALLGLLIMAAGLFLMSNMDMETTKKMAVTNMIIVGLGLGISFPIFTLTVQNAVEHRMLGVATASSQLFRQVGGMVGVSVMGSVMSSFMDGEISSLAAEAGLSQWLRPDQLPVPLDPQMIVDPARLALLKSAWPESAQEVFPQLVLLLRQALGNSLTGVFCIGGIIILVALVITAFLKETELKTSNRKVHTVKEPHLNNCNNS